MAVFSGFNEKTCAERGPAGIRLIPFLCAASGLLRGLLYYFRIPVGTSFDMVVDLPIDGLISLE